MKDGMITMLRHAQQLEEQGIIDKEGYQDFFPDDME